MIIQSDDSHPWSQHLASGKCSGLKAQKIVLWMSPHPWSISETAVTTSEWWLPFIEHLLCKVLKTCCLVSSQQQQYMIGAMTPCFRDRKAKVSQRQYSSLSPAQFCVVLHSSGKDLVRKFMSLAQKEWTWENTCSSLYQRHSCKNTMVWKL